MHTKLYKFFAKYTNIFIRTLRIFMLEASKRAYKNIS